MFRSVRRDTRVSSVEARYGICLNARADALIGNLLERRGFDSVTQLVAAARGRLFEHPRPRRIFLSFHAEDQRQVQGFRLMAINPGVPLDFADESLLVAIESDRAPYVRAVIKEKIRRAEVVCCLIGNGTAWRKWVDWELTCAHDLHKGLCGVRLKESRGRTPPLLRELNVPIAPWETAAIVGAIERAAALRS